MEIRYAIGRESDGLIVVPFEKANCTQVTETTFKRLGLLDAAKKHHPFVHNYRWEVYTTQNPPPTVADIRRANRNGCACLKFVRDPIDRFGSIYSRYLRHGFRGIPNGLTIDGFLDALEPLKIRRFEPGAYPDPHLQTQCFWKERHDMWTEIVPVERLREPAFRTYLKEAYGLDFDPSFTSPHWEGKTYAFTAAQKRRIMQVYRVDKRYRHTINKNLVH
jgi:hypothetical protein